MTNIKVGLMNLHMWNASTCDRYNAQFVNTVPKPSTKPRNSRGEFSKRVNDDQCSSEGSTFLGNKHAELRVQMGKRDKSSVKFVNNV
jgi:hypothetical protein